MAETTSAGEKSAPIPSAARLKKAEAFTREPFVHKGEDAKVALAPGTARRRALDMALRELDEGLKVPSTKWRRSYSMLLGLERVLSEPEPRLADGTSLNPHQVDALSGTLVALLTADQGNGTATPATSAAPVLAIDETAAYAPVHEPPPPEVQEPEEPRRTRTTSDEDDEPSEPDEDEDDDDEDEDDEPATAVEDEERRGARRGRVLRGRRRRATSTRTSTRAPRTTPTRTSASGSSTRPAPARPSPPWASSTPPAPAAS